MENWRENLSIISRLKVAGNQTDALASRLSFERLFTGANFQPPGIPSRTVVCIKKLNASFLKDNREIFAAGNMALEWEIGIRREVEKLFRRAFRPIREAVPAQAECVIFEDVAEMLACLARDWLRGELNDSWWWRGLFPQKTLFQIWLASAEFTPFALEILSKTAGAEKFVKKLPRDEAFELLREIIRIFGLDKLKSALFEPLEKKGRKIIEPTAKTKVKSRFPEEANLTKTAKSDAFFDFLIPAGADLSFAQSCLLETGLLLARSPRMARSTEFAERVKIKRVENEFSKAAPAVKSARVFEKNKALEIRVTAPKKTIRKLTDKVEAPLNPSPPETFEPPIFVAEKVEKGEKKPGKTSSDLKKTPEPANEAAAESPVESKKIGDAPKPPKIAFEGAPAEKSFEKPRQKAPPEDRKIIKPASAEQIFENFFKDFETEPDFSFQTRFGGVFYLLNLGLYLGLYRDFTETLTAEIDLNIWDFVALLGLEFLGGEIKSDAVWEFLKRAAERENDDEFGREFDPFQDWRMSPGWLETFSANQQWLWAKNKKRLVVRHPDGFNVIDVARRGDASAQVTSELEIYRNKFSRLTKAGKKEILTVKPESWLRNLAEYMRKRLFQALNLQTPEELNATLFARNATVSVSATHLEITFALADLPIEVRLAGIDRNPAWIPAAGKFVYFYFV